MTQLKTWKVYVMIHFNEKDDAYQNKYKNGDIYEQKLKATHKNESRGKDSNNYRYKYKNRYT